MQYFYGPDTLGAREEIGNIAGKHKAAIRWLDKGELTEKPLVEWLDSSSSSLFGNELVVIRDGATMSKALQEVIITEVKNKRDTNWIVWDREKPDRRTEYFKVLKKHGQEFPAVSTNELVSWLMKEGKIEMDAARELVFRVGSDRWALKNELNRLNLLHSPAQTEDVRREVPLRDIPEEIFAALDALSSGDTARALSLIEKQLAAGESELYVLSMLAYQFKTLLAVKTKQTKGLHPFVVEKNTPAARRFSPNMLQDALTKIMATDFAIKQGKVDARTGLMMLTVSLVEKSPARAGQ